MHIDACKLLRAKRGVLIAIAIESTRLVAAILFYLKKKKKKINNEELFMNEISYFQIAFTIC